MLDVGVLADLLFAAQVSGYSAFDIRRQLERRAAKFLFLFHAVRAPISAVHDYLLVTQALRESVVTMTAPVEGESGDCQEQNCNGSYFGKFPPIGGRHLLSLLLPFSSLFRHLALLYHDVQRRGQHVQRFTMDRKHFPVDHDINRGFQLEIDASNRLMGSEGMPDVRSIVQRGQIANQP